MIALRCAEQGETIPCAVPIEAIAEVCPTVNERLLEEELLQQLASILRLGEWFTDKALKAFYESLPFPNLLRYDEPEDKPQAIVTQLRGKNRVYDFIDCLRAKRPDISLTSLIKLLPAHSLDFVNRDDELEKATGRHALSYLFFEAPAGYGKTELLRAIEQREFADGRLCVYIDVPLSVNSALALAQIVAEQAGYAVPLNLSIEAVAYTLVGFLQGSDDGSSESGREA
jgi:hypothetical protein